MTVVYSLNDHRRAKRRAFLQIHGDRLDRFICTIVEEKLRLSYDLLLERYLEVQRQNSEDATWDYVELRDQIRSGFDATLGQDLWQSLRRQSWFEPALFDRTTIAEHWVGTIILGSSPDRYLPVAP